MLKTVKNIPTRVVKAFGYSFDGLKSAFIKEESFRLEAFACLILAVALIISPWPGWKKAAMLAVYMLIPLCELLNSAIEDICDMVSPEINPYVKSAKDKGSAAVLLAIIANILTLAALVII